MTDDTSAAANDLPLAVQVTVAATNDQSLALNAIGIADAVVTNRVDQIAPFL